jgi:hypothetical protein
MTFWATKADVIPDWRTSSLGRLATLDEVFDTELIQRSLNGPGCVKTILEN